MHTAKWKLLLLLALMVCNCASHVLILMNAKNSCELVQKVKGNSDMETWTCWSPCDEGVKGEGLKFNCLLRKVVPLPAPYLVTKVTVLGKKHVLLCSVLHVNCDCELLTTYTFQYTCNAGHGHVSLWALVGVVALLCDDQFYIECSHVNVILK